MKMVLEAVTRGRFFSTLVSTLIDRKENRR
jgi:hypothetical protein